MKQEGLRAEVVDHFIDVLYRQMNGAPVPEKELSTFTPKELELLAKISVSVVVRSDVTPLLLLLMEHYRNKTTMTFNLKIEE